MLIGDHSLITTLVQVAFLHAILGIIWKVIDQRLG